MKSQRGFTSPEQQSQKTGEVTLAPPVTIVPEEISEEDTSAQPVPPRSELEMITRAKTLSMRLEQLLQTNKRLAKADNISSQNNNNNNNNNNGSDSDNDVKTEQNNGNGRGRDSSLVVSSSGSSSDNESEQPRRPENNQFNKDTIVGMGKRNNKPTIPFRGKQSGKAENDEGSRKSTQLVNERELQPKQGLDDTSMLPTRVSFPGAVPESQESAMNAVASSLPNNQNAGSSSSSVHQYNSSSEPEGPGGGEGGIRGGLSLSPSFRGGTFVPSTVATTDLTDAASFLTAIGVALPDEAELAPKPHHSNTRTAPSSSSAGSSATVIASTVTTRGLSESNQTATTQVLSMSAQSTARSSGRTVENKDDNDDDHDNKLRSNIESSRSQSRTTAGDLPTSNQQNHRLPGQGQVSTDQHSNQRNEEDMRKLVGGGLDDSTLAARILAKTKRAQVRNVFVNAIYSSCRLVVLSYCHWPKT